MDGTQTHNHQVSRPVLYQLSHQDSSAGISTANVMYIRYCMYQYNTTFGLNVSYSDIGQEVLQLLLVAYGLHCPDNDLSTSLYLLQQLQLEVEDVDDGSDGLCHLLVPIPRCLQVKMLLQNGCLYQRKNYK